MKYPPRILVSPKAVSVARYIARRNLFDESGASILSEATVGQACNIGVDAVYRALVELEALGALRYSQLLEHGHADRRRRIEESRDHWLWVALKQDADRSAAGVAK